MLTTAVFIAALMMGSEPAATSIAEQAGLPEAKAGQQVTRIYAIVYQPGPAWKRGRPLAEQNLEQHSLYMRRLVESGMIQAAGPLSSIEGGLVLIRTGSLAEAREAMEQDPAVRNQQFVGFVSVWKPAFDPNGWFPKLGTKP